MDASLRTRRALIGAVLAVFLTLLLVPNWNPATADREPHEPAAKGEVTAAVQDWPRHLASGETVRFVLERPTTEGLDRREWDVKGLGKIDAKAKQYLRVFFQKGIRSERMQLQKLLANLDPLSEADILGEACLRTNIATYEAELACLEKDDYVAVLEGSTVPAEYPGAQVFYQNIVESHGRKVDVIFVIKPDEHPVLKEAQEYSRQITEYTFDTRVLSFNSLPLEERQARIRKHDQAKETLRKGLPDKKNMSRVQRAHWRDAVAKDLIHHYLLIDRGRFRVSRRPKRR